MLVTACGSSASPTSSNSGSSATTNNAAAIANNKALQQDLAKVGCYSGSIDGALGPLTVQAIRGFQTAAGLSVDGLYGPSTQAKLLADVKAGTQVCSSSTTTTAGGSSTSTGGSSTTASSNTTTGGSGAPCTSAAINEGLASGETVDMWQCAKGWAAGSQTNGHATSAFLVQAKNGGWVPAPADACTNAGALGIPPAILAVSYCKVS